MLEAWIKTDRFIHDELQLNPLPSKTKQKTDKWTKYKNRFIQRRK